VSEGWVQLKNFPKTPIRGPKLTKHTEDAEDRKVSPPPLTSRRVRRALEAAAQPDGLRSHRNGYAGWGSSARVSGQETLKHTQPRRRPAIAAHLLKERLRQPTWIALGGKGPTYKEKAASEGVHAGSAKRRGSIAAMKRGASGAIDTDLQHTRQKGHGFLPRLSRIWELVSDDRGARA